MDNFADTSGIVLQSVTVTGVELRSGDDGDNTLLYILLGVGGGVLLCVVVTAITAYLCCVRSKSSTQGSGFRSTSSAVKAATAGMEMTAVSGKRGGGGKGKGASKEGSTRRTNKGKSGKDGGALAPQSDETIVHNVNPLVSAERVNEWV